ncbi:MAG: SDR family oxidoreductase [Deltaproteobacteria bacterium]|nr:SDR family oxidoreductase [Deltaproteobacteria bacterium]
MSRVVLITGGSRGIGAATARLAAAHGYAVGVNYVQAEEAARNVVGEIETAGGRAIALRGDVSKEADVVGMFERVAEELGPPTALVNNAGVVMAQARLEAMSAERLERMFAVNVMGAFLCAREAVRRMSTQHGSAGGVIVNVSSGASRRGSPGEWVDYAASKGAIDSMTIGLAKEVAAEGIRVVAVRPGLVKTEIHTAGGEPARVERMAPLVPMQRGGEPGEVAEAILWLMSSAASYTTGAILDVAGGL